MTRLGQVVLILGLLVLAIYLAGCATTPVYLQHPTTGVRTQCGPYTNMHPFFPALSPHWKAERECIADYQRQGFERMPTTGRE